MFILEVVVECLKEVPCPSIRTDLDKLNAELDVGGERCREPADAIDVPGKGLHPRYSVA